MNYHQICWFFPLPVWILCWTPLMKIFNSIIIFFSSKVSFWFRFIISIPLLTLSFFSYIIFLMFTFPYCFVCIIIFSWKLGIWKKFFPLVFADWLCWGRTSLIDLAWRLKVFLGLLWPYVFSGPGCVCVFFFPFVPCKRLLINYLISLRASTLFLRGI